jgi:hypothetical protein
MASTLLLFGGEMGRQQHTPPEQGAQTAANEKGGLKPALMSLRFVGTPQAGYAAPPDDLGVKFPKRKSCSPSLTGDASERQR